MNRPEAYGDPDLRTDATAYELGQQLDEASPAKHNGNFFEEALLRARERGNDVASLPEVKVVANGHCHVTDRCRRIR